MAVDTAQKRYSMIAFGDDNQMLFEVDGAVDLDDRQHLLGAYSGIAFSSAVAEAITRLGLSGTPRGLYGSFEGKTPGVPTGRITPRLAGAGGLAGYGGLAGHAGGMAG